MSVASKKRRRAVRTGRRRAWAAIGRDGALVAPDVCERLVAMLPKAEMAELRRVGVSYGGVTIRVEPMLAPGTVMPMPALWRHGLRWPDGTHVFVDSGRVGFSPPMFIPGKV